jgi:hypothetical protein
MAARRYRRPLPAFHLSFDERVSHAVRRQLGAPATRKGDASPAGVLAPLVRAVAETARRIAMAEPHDRAELASEPRENPAAKGKGR